MVRIIVTVVRGVVGAAVVAVAAAAFVVMLPLAILVAKVDEIAEGWLGE